MSRSAATATSTSIRSPRTSISPNAVGRRRATRRGAASSGCMEEKHTAELTSDFEDYEIGEERARKARQRPR